MVNKHTASDLAQMQSLPLEAKIRMSKQRIRDWYEHFDGMVYVSFSGGKDSTVLKHLVDSMYSDVPAVFVNTGLEYPEIQKFVRELKTGKYDCFNSDVEILRPEMRFDEVIMKYGYPAISKDVSNCIYWARRGSPSRLARVKGTVTKKDGTPSMFNCKKWEFMMDAPFEISNECCNVMKKKPTKKYERFTGRKPLLGLMASESIKRRTAWMKTGCNAFEKGRQQSQPMAFWTDQDILEYIVKYNVPYASIYGKIQEEGQLEGQMYIDGFHEKLYTTGVDRTGCIFCMFGITRDLIGENGDKNRFQRLKETHPRQYEYCINGGEMADGKWQPSKEGLGLGKVLDFIGVPYE